MFDYLYIISFLFVDIYFHVLVLVSRTILLVSDPNFVGSSFLMNYRQFSGPRRKGAPVVEECIKIES